nr:phage virion morphogenesis protein [Nannocystis pusilla]
MQDLFGRLPDAQTKLLFEAVGSELESQTRRRLSDEKEAPDGSEWHEWSTAYAASRPPKGGLLELDGDLIDSIEYSAATEEVVVGSGIVYARRHQLGDEDAGIPARPYIGLSKANVADVLALVFDFLEEEMFR